jgi:hypothetical protein
MNRFTMVCCAAALVGCYAADRPVEEEASDASMISLADVAGVWTMQAFADTGNTALITYEMLATDSAEGWVVTFPDREPLPARLLPVEGDSMVIDVGPYESVLRQGVMVSTQSVFRLDDANLTGTFVARYETTQADSLLRGRQQGTRKQ